MVLLTQSTVSVIISSGIVCSFTFLLFLSGYVLQQQTVRSLQDAIRNPPEKPYIPVPTLPPQFQKNNDSLSALPEYDELGASAVNLEGGQQSLLGMDTAQLAAGLAGASLSDTPSEPTIEELWNKYVDDSIKQRTIIPEVDQPTSLETSSPSVTDTAPQDTRLAYILVLPNLSDLCSALLFTNQQRAHRTSNPDYPSISIVLIYPATWDTSDRPSHAAAMSLLRSHHDTHHDPSITRAESKVDLVYHPVTISRVWAGVSLESQLLAELQRTRWPYDRAMYIRSPGITISHDKLDGVLQSTAGFNVTTEAKTKSKRKDKTGSKMAEWIRMDSRNTGANPKMLVYFDGEGLWVPGRGNGGVVELRNGDFGMGVVAEGEARGAGYAVFSDGELEARRNGGVGLSGGKADEILKRFERERKGVCEGTGLLGS